MSLYVSDAFIAEIDAHERRQKVKRADLMVAEAAHDSRLASLRGPKGAGQNDPAHPHLTRAGFVPGEKVSVVLTADLDLLLRAAEPEVRRALGVERLDAQP